MNHGGLVFLTREGIYLPEDIVRPISGQDGSTLHGFFYPVELSARISDNPDVRHDFMLTPIPTRYWPCAARVVVRIKHIPGAAQHIAQRFKDLGWTILNAECTRSAYGYATWYMSVAYEDFKLEPRAGKDDYAGKIQEQVVSQLGTLESQLRESCEEWLFTERDTDLDPSFRHPVTTRTAGALAYFHGKACESLGKEPGDPRVCSPFRLKLNRNHLALGDESYRDIVDAEFDPMFSDERDSLVCLAEMDSVSCNIRIAVLTPDLEHKFVHATMRYKRRSPQSSTMRTSKGLLASVLAELQGGMDLYRIANLTLRDELSGEEGTYHFLGKLLDGQSEATISQKILQTQVKDVDPGIAITESKVHRLSERNFRQYAKFMGATIGWEHRRDLFVSYSHSQDDSAGFELLRAGLDRRKIDYETDLTNRNGEDFTKEILAKIRRCRFFLLFATEKSLDSRYVHAEIGAAIGMGKRVFVLCYSNTTKDKSIQEIPYLRNSQVDNWDRREAVFEEISRELGEFIP